MGKANYSLKQKQKPRKQLDKVVNSQELISEKLIAIITEPAQSIGEYFRGKYDKSKSFAAIFRL